MGDEVAVTKVQYQGYSIFPEIGLGCRGYRVRVIATVRV